MHLTSRLPASGVSVIFAHISERNIHSMLRGTIIAMALISLILIWVFKSVRLGLVSLVPNFIPAAMSFGLWGYLVGHVGLASSVVVAVTFGIIVDDTVHFLSKYLKARREGLLAPESRALCLSHRRLCVMDHNRDFISRLFGVRHIGFRTQLGTRPVGHDHNHFRSCRRFSASSNSADCH